MSWWFLATALLAFFFLDAIVSVVVVRGDEVREELTSVSNVARALVVPYAVSTAVACWVTQRLGWWDVVLHERRRVRPWVWIVPVSFVVTSVALADFGRLRLAGAAVALTLLVGTLLVAGGEEIMFRGVVLQALRDRYAESTAALLTAVAFGASHFLAGPLNVLVSALFGYLLYWCRRVSGGLVVPVVVHTLWDFSVWTGFTTPDEAKAAAAPAALSLLTFALVLLIGVRRRSLDASA